MRRQSCGSLLLAVVLFAAGCTGRSDSGGATTTAPTTATAETTFGATTVPTTPLRALPTTNPRMTVAVEGDEIADLRLGFVEWSGESQDPPDQDPSADVVVAEGATVAFTAPHPADLAIRWSLFSEQSSFVSLSSDRGDPSLERTLDDATLTLTAPEPGLWIGVVNAEFDESDRYAGSGVLRSAIRLRVVPATSSCPNPERATISGVWDQDGCADVPTGIRLNLDALVPWFHCSSWPAILTWTAHPTATATEFIRDPFGADGVAVGDLPTDAAATGFWLTAGELLTSPSYAESVFVDLGDGSAERWDAYVEQEFCA